MDDLIKLLQNLIANKPKPKGGIADSAEGVEFIGKQLSKKQLKEYELINTRVTDPSGLSAITIRNVGRDNRYMYMRDFNDDFTGQFEDVIKFLQDNPDVRLTQAQKDNILYNLGVYRRVNTEKAKLEKGIIEQGKNPDEIYKKSNEERPIQELSFTQALERMLKITEDMKAKAKETDDIFAPQEVSPERKLRIKRLYDGPGYDDPNSAVFRGLGSKYLPMLHEKGIIKLDDQIYQNLKQGKHHWGGAMYNAPDPVRIWRYHFGNEVFDKMNKWNYNNDDVFKWIEQNNIQPIKREGPTNALEYLTPTEIQQNLSDELSAFKKYKNPEQLDENSRKFFYADKPDQRMERITYHGENIQALENVLQKTDPASYKEYYRTNKATQQGAEIIPFKKDQGILSVKSGAEAEDMLKDFLQKSDQISGANVKPIKQGQTTKLDTLPMRLLKNFNTEFRLEDLTNEGYSKEQADVLIKAKNKITSGEEINPNEALLRVKEEMADDAGVDVDELDFDFQIEEPEPIDEFAKGGVVSNRKGFERGGMGLLGLLGGITPYQEDVIPDVDFFSGITDDDIYNEYDEKEGYTSIFKQGFTTKDGKEIEIPYRPDRDIDIGGLLEVFDRTDLGTPPGDYRSKRIKEYDI